MGCVCNVMMREGWLTNYVMTGHLSVTFYTIVFLLHSSLLCMSTKIIWYALAALSKENDHLACYMHGCTKYGRYEHLNHTIGQNDCATALVKQ